MKPWTNVLIVWTFFCLLGGCSTKQDLVILSPVKQDPTTLLPSERELIVLLPDPEGKVGILQVTTEGGSRILEEPGCATQVEDVSMPPTVPQPLDEAEIASVFGRALSAQPDVTGRFVSFLLYFKSDTTQLTDESRNMLPEVVRSITNRNSKEVFVVGHTDRVGTEVYNRELSSRRAQYVRDQLVSRAVNSTALVVSFHGETMPLVTTEDEVAEPLNRRVEVIVK
jgi:outer membrane protein OmpA-like peptidoglycan-associated protein